MSGSINGIYRLALAVWLAGLVLPGGAVAAGAGNADQDDLAGSGTGPGRVAAVVVRIDDASLHADDLERLALDLIDIPAGVPFEPALVDQARSAVAQSGCFRLADVRVEAQAEGRRITFDLIPYPRIKAIHIRGRGGLFENEITKVMNMRVGGPLVEDQLAIQEELIRNLYLREGYIDPQVSLTANIDPDDQRAVLQVGITAGAFYSWEQLNFIGNRAFGQKRLKAHMASWDPLISFGGRKRFVEREMRDDLRALLAFYRKKGYADARLEAQLHPDGERRRMAVDVTVEEGPLYAITFSGNHALKSRVLKQDLVLFTQGNRRDGGLRKSLRKIRSRYRAAGFAGVRVKLSRETPESAAGENREVKIVIAEGPRTLVEKVTVKGNHTLSAAAILGTMGTQPPRFLRSGALVPGVLNDDLARIRTLYLEAGYPEAIVQKQLSFNHDKSRVVVGIEITEGTQLKVSEVFFEGLAGLTVREALAVLELKPGTPYREHMLARDEKALAALVSETGYPHVQVKGRAALDKASGLVTLVYAVEQGVPVKLGSIHFIGNLRTRSWRLLQVAGLVPGEPFSLRRIAEAKRDLMALDVWDSVVLTPIGLRQRRPEVELLIELEEKKPYLLEVGGGYESDRGAFGEVTVGDRNLLGCGQHGWISGQISQIGYRGELAVTHPYLVGTPFRLEAGAYGERKEEFNLDFGTEVWGIHGGIHREAFHRLDLGFNVTLEHRDQFDKDEGGGLFSGDASLGRDPRTILTIAPFATVNLRDAVIRPRRGFYSHLQLDFSNGFENDLDDFTKLRWDLRGYFTPWSRLTLAALGRVGYLRPWGGSRTVPEDQVFYLGGIQDVRGFAENMLWRDDDDNALGGQQAVAGSLEARLDLGRNLELTFFYDRGQVRRTALGADGSSDWRDSAGLGLWYHTPVGPIGVMYGHKLDRRQGEDPGRFHFSIGYTF